MHIIPLSEGSFTIDNSKIFIPFNTDTDILQERARGSLLVEIQPFVVITGRDIILLDTGLGFYNPDGTMQLHQHLVDNDIRPEAVTKVLLSHLHKDHAGGIQDSRNNRLSFPAATYYLNQKEYSLASTEAGSSYEKKSFSLLASSSQLVLLEENGVIDNYISYQLTGGHSPYHTSFTINEEGEKIFYGGDVAPQLQQMKNRFVAKYDYDGKKAMELRNIWWNQGKEEHWTFLFYHDIRYPFIKL